MNIATCLAMYNALSANRNISTKRSSDSISENYEKYDNTDFVNIKIYGKRKNKED